MEELKSGLQEINAYLVYCSGFYGNMGNHKGFGDGKFVPNMEEERMELLVKSSQAYKSSPEKMEALWQSVKGPLFSLSDQEKQLGLGEKGITKYFTPNCQLADSQTVNQFMKTKNLEGYISRVIKTVEAGKTVYEIRHAGVENKEEYEECLLKVTTLEITRIFSRLWSGARHEARGQKQREDHG